MKFTKIIKKVFCFLLTVTFIFGGTSAYYAAAKTYSFSDLSIQIEVPSELAIFTRNVTSADANLKLIDTSAEELQVMFVQRGIYLEAFPNDISYEIIVSGKDATEGLKDFNTLSNSDLNEELQKYREKCESVETDEIYNVTTYKNNSTTFYQTDFKSQANDAIVYVKKYYTVMQGKELYFTVQSNAKEVSDEQASQLKAIVDSTVYKHINPSITELPIFTELAGYFIGFLVTVVVLGGILFIMTKSTQIKKKKN